MSVATREHCFYCFETLVAHLEVRDPDLPSLAGTDDNAEPDPLFVTWNIRKPSQPHPRLRGCIGNFSAMNLHSGLKDYAIISALRDRRFSPITDKELPYLTCSVSLLVHFEEAADYLDWEVGKHGLWISFRDPSNPKLKRTATYLPEVAAEQGWTKVEAIDSLLQKGGFHGRVTDAMRKSIKLTRYQSDKCSATYDEYAAWRMERHRHRADAAVTLDEKEETADEQALDDGSSDEEVEDGNGNEQEAVEEKRQRSHRHQQQRGQKRIRQES
ncbi:hypothetical protein RI367_002924 [Sorochytrium milnesiophthora]